MQITDLAMYIVKLNRGDKLSDETIRQIVVDLKFLSLMAETDNVCEHYWKLAKLIEDRDWDGLRELNDAIVDEHKDDFSNCEDVIYSTAFDECHKYLGSAEAAISLVNQAFIDAEQMLFYFSAEDGVGCFWHFDSDDEGTVSVIKVEIDRMPSSFTQAEIEANRQAMLAWWEDHKDVITHIVMLVYKPENVHVKGSLSSIVKAR